MRNPRPRFPARPPALRDHPDLWLPDRSVVTGGRPPAYASAVARLSPSPDPRAAFLAATRFLGMGTTWALSALSVPSPPGPGR
ncbi:hypothetical protein [Actinacidiphila sp. ITFR-21]|uniref:hypothetical protein n=1 Tax=Actinacidiphila sp. ITFR-21 TaxID=3075199 RepID=UPI0028893F91|nr:hypothetical protein [Streptomyces sp. ITFR-21]WNI16399.1 hypothetical protein RLT57_13335 [Streptomyces sp. ITFR-21]